MPAVRHWLRAALVEGAAFALAFGWLWFADLTRLLANRQPEIFHGSLLSGDCASVFALSFLGGLALFFLRDRAAQGGTGLNAVKQGGRAASALALFLPALAACLLFCGAFLLLRHLPENRIRHLLPPAMLGLAAACSGHFHLDRLLRLQGTAIYMALSCAAVFSILWVIFFRLAPWPPLPFMAGAGLLAAGLCLLAPKPEQEAALPGPEPGPKYGPEPDPEHGPEPDPEPATESGPEHGPGGAAGQLPKQIPGQHPALLPGQLPERALVGKPLARANLGRAPLTHAPFARIPFERAPLALAAVFFALMFFSLGFLHTIQPAPNRLEWLRLLVFAAACALGGRLWQRNFRPALALVALALPAFSLLTLLDGQGGQSGGIALNAASGLLQAALFCLAADYSIRGKAASVPGALFVAVNTGAIAAQLLFFAGAGLPAVALGAFCLLILVMFGLSMLFAYKARARGAAVGNPPAGSLVNLAKGAGQEAAGQEAPAPQEKNAESGLLGTLSYAERRVAGLLLKGYSNPAICAELHLSDNTVRTHLKNIYRKTGVHGRENLKKLLAEPCAPL